MRRMRRMRRMRKMRKMRRIRFKDGYCFICLMRNRTEFLEVSKVYRYLLTRVSSFLDH